MVSNYSSRILTFDDDIVNAFAEVIEVIGPLFPDGFHYNLPETFFDLALLWQSTDGVRRRLSTNGFNTFLSWSWIGWVGAVTFTLPDACEDYARNSRYHIVSLNPVTTYKKRRRLDGNLEPITNSYSHFRYLHEATTSSSLPPGWTRHGDGDEAYFTHVSVEHEIFDYPIPLPLERTRRNPPSRQYDPHLIFQAERAWFTIGEAIERELPRIHPRTRIPT